MSDDKSQTKKSSSVVEFLKDVNIGYMVAGAASMWTAWKSINHKFYENLWNNNDDPKYKELRKKRTDNINEAFGASETINVKNKEGVVEEVPRSFKNAIKKVKQGQREYHFGLEKALEDAKILFPKEEDALGIKNVGRKWKLLMRHQKQQVGATFATVLSIAVGAYMIYNKNEKAAHKLDHQAKVQGTQLVQEEKIAAGVEKALDSWEARRQAQLDQPQARTQALS